MCQPLLWAAAFVCCCAAIAQADLSVYPWITVGTFYTDNVFLSPTDQDHDWGTFVRPALTLDWISRTAGLGVTYEPTYIVFTRNPEKTYWRQNVVLDGWAEIARNSRIELTNRFLYTQDPVTDTDATGSQGGEAYPDADADTTVRQGREPYARNTTTIGIVNQFGVEDTIELMYRHHILENEDPAFEDSSFRQPNLLWSHWFVPNRYSANVVVKYTLGDFEESEDFEDFDASLRLTKRFNRRFDGYFEYGYIRFDYLEDGEDYQVHGPLVGIVMSEQSNASFEASIGYYIRDNEISDDDMGPRGSFDVTYAYAKGGLASLYGFVGFDRAFFGAENLGFRPFFDVGGALTHQFTPRIGGELRANYRRNIYNDEIPTREDALWRGGAGLSYRALSWLRFNLDYLYRQVNSTIDTNDYTENRATLSVTLSPGTPIRF